jgi:hypothetical protein
MATRVIPASRRYAILDALSVTGYGFAVWSVTVLRPNGLTVADPAGYLRAGHALISGTPVYLYVVGDQLAVSYAPPWIVLFAALTLLPPLAVQIGLMAANFAALRYVAGSWRAVGLALLWPPTITFLLSGNIDLLISAAIVLAWRGRAWPLALFGLAKLGPILGLPPSRWREAAVALGLAFLVTLPWVFLWPQWVTYLVTQPPGVQNGLVLAWCYRLPIAIALAVVIRRPWASALAVVVGMPSLYPPTSMEGFAVIRLWFDGRLGADTSPLGPARRRRSS